MKTKETEKKKRRRRRRRKEFSKSLLIQESLLIWIQTLSMLVLAFVCVFRNAHEELPWLAAMVAFPWTAYGISQAFYYNKAKRENTSGGVVFETAMAELDAATNDETPLG